MFKFEIGQKVFTVVEATMFQAEVEGRQTIERKGKDGETIVSYVYTLKGLPTFNDADYKPFEIEEVKLFATLEELVKTYNQGFVVMRLEDTAEGIEIARKNVQVWEVEIEKVQQQINKAKEEAKKMQAAKPTKEKKSK